MRDNIEDESGLERLGRAFVVLVAIGSLAVISVGAHMLYALWKGLA